ncbi:unnamed protein product [Phyllotreta striolata]|uniref:MSP domain-containing protein n=1 Tax=Phyllotreta striolata TaxID=444603 RepID=A0A9N9XJ89_PHYSR|nr:unnamed protein product [Phyllotreta striolata]
MNVDNFEPKIYSTMKRNDNNSNQHTSTQDDCLLKYLKPNLSHMDSQISLPNESTISESDLLSPNYSSTPRSSNSLLHSSFAQISRKLGDMSVNIDDVVSDVHKALRSNSSNIRSFSLDEGFIPGEEAASALLADELSWLEKYELPCNKDYNEKDFTQTSVAEELSIGGYFRNNCNNLNSFFKTSDASADVTRESLKELPVIESDNSKKSLTATTIAKLVASDDSVQTILDKLHKMVETSNKNQPTSNDRSENKENIDAISSSSGDSSSTLQSKRSVELRLPSDTSLSASDVPTRDTNSKNTLDISSRPSSRASSAMTSLPNDKLPLETSKCNVVWGCVKLGKSVTKEFVIRNRSSKKLHLQLSMQNRQFRLRKDCSNDSEPLNSMKMSLHAHESKSVIVSFIPKEIGAALGELYFTSLHPQFIQTKKQCVKLFGYGGLVKVDFQNLTLYNACKFVHSIGKLDNKSVVTSNFFAKNNGNLPVFIHISINSLKSNLSVNPSFFVLLPEEKKTITINYKPSNDDFKSLNQSVQSSIIDLGSLNVIFGSEADRGRMRKICETCAQNGCEIPAVANILKEPIDGECIPVDLFKYKEPPEHIHDLIKYLKHYQVMLTLERDLEQTIIQQLSDETVMYQSLCQDNTVIFNKTSAQNCRVSPTTIFFILPYKSEDSLYLHSQSLAPLNFKVCCEHQEIELKPREGRIKPNGTVIIHVKYLSASISKKKDYKILVIAEQDIFEVDVNVEFLETMKNKKKSVLSGLNCSG